MDKRPDNKWEKRATLFVCILTAFLPPFTNSSISIALPTIGKYFSLDAVTLGWVATAFLLPSAMFLVPFGRLSDIVGRKRILAIGVVIFILCAFMMTVSTSGTMLITFRALQGIGAAMTFGTSVAILTSVFPPGERGRVLGLNSLAVYTGLSLGPTIGGVLTQLLGWRSIFAVTIPLGLAILAALPFMKGEWAEAKGEKLDIPGTTIFSVSLLALTYGLSILPASYGIVLIMMGAFGLGAFIWWVLRAPSPVLDLRIFKHNYTFLLSNLAALINYSATWAVTFLLSLYLQIVKGMDPESSGLVLLAQPLFMAILSPIAGRLSDRIQPRLVATTGMALNMGGLVILATLNTESPILLVIVSLAIMGIGFGLFSSPNTNAVMSSVERRYFGVASGFLATMRTTGQLLSMAIAMLLFSVLLGSVQVNQASPPTMVVAIRTAFAVSAGLCFIGIFFSLARGKTQR